MNEGIIENGNLNNEGKDLNSRTCFDGGNTRGGKERFLSSVNTPCRRLMIFIDGGNLFHGAKACGLDLRFKKIVDFLSEGYDLIRVYYYTGVPTRKMWNRKESEEVFIRKLNKQRSFLDSLSFDLNIEVVTKPLVVVNGKIIEKGIDVRIASDIIWHGLSDNYDSFILVSGDMDLMDCLIRMKDNGKRVIVANFAGRVSKELKRVADKYISLSDNLEAIRR